MTTLDHIVNAEVNQIATTQLAVNRQVKQSWFAEPMIEL
jgi:hypothetical protein